MQPGEIGQESACMLNPDHPYFWQLQISLTATMMTPSCSTRPLIFLYSGCAFRNPSMRYSGSRFPVSNRTLMPIWKLLSSIEEDSKGSFFAGTAVFFDFFIGSFFGFM